jgi:hypothetical protein
MQRLDKHVAVNNPTRERLFSMRSVLGVIVKTTGVVEAILGQFLEFLRKRFRSVNMWSCIV